MGFLAKILNFKDRKVKIDSGGGNIITAPQYAPAGDDSQPLITDTAVAVETQRTGSAVTVGYYDNKSTQKAKAGEKRIYARNSNGEVVAEIWLKNDGSIIIQNDNCEFNLSEDGIIKGNNSAGSFELNTAGEFVVDKLKVGSIEFDLHVHGGVTTGAGITGVAQ